MLIRRIRDTARKQNWGTAIIQVAVVVLGIFIGLQADNWNQARKDRMAEREYLVRLHDELQTSLALEKTIRERQERTWQSMIGTLEVLFSQGRVDDLSADQCAAVGLSAYLQLVSFDLPSLGELVSTGRVAILRDAELRLALTKLEQTSQATRNDLQSSVTTHLATKYPDLMQMEAYWSEQEDEIRIRFQCNLAAMRSNRGFLSDFSLNVDSFDGFYNKDVRRELAQLQAIHQRVDELLYIRHTLQ